MCILHWHKFLLQDIYLLILYNSFINVINEYISSAINKITNSFFTDFVFRHIDRTLAKAGRSKLIFGQ